MRHEVTKEYRDIVTLIKYYFIQNHIARTL